MLNSYSVYADYGPNDPRTREYLIGTLEETQKWVQSILDNPKTTLTNVGQLTLTIINVRGRAVSTHTVTTP